MEKTYHVTIERGFAAFLTRYLLTHDATIRLDSFRLEPTPEALVEALAIPLGTHAELRLTVNDDSTVEEFERFLSTHKL
ncbi:hypothetical protein [Exiguobacterium aurantiacum]|uniref:PTS HPr component phosphorylation site n=1 Tax=Exiguobacterium aurantiacum TaxID=33987 RepID=A0ABY5FPQ5_9BACL|nr:hypothetical protein [Exiguobacterium aurantiacum]UTT43426.1 hypothetical protein NMQ00_02690 [Exiguobacterium aurantiacum]